MITWININVKKDFIQKYYVDLYLYNKYLNNF